jgi:hypothetical protein
MAVAKIPRIAVYTIIKISHKTSGLSVGMAESLFVLNSSAFM